MATAKIAIVVVVSLLILVVVVVAVYMPHIKVVDAAEIVVVV